jgi:hypothetical protein
MRFNEFKRARKLIIENKNVDQLLESEVYEFISTKYDEQLNEGIFSAVVGWFKRNFSPTAYKIKNLAKDYYAWLTNEFTATYKGSDDETSLEKFYKTEKVSDDLEDKMLKAAGDDESYRKLAEELILEYKIRAKKDFASKILGPGSNLNKNLERDLATSTGRVNDIMNDLSKEDTVKFKKNLTDLKIYIKKQGKWSDKQATTLASGIMIFAQNRKIENYVDMSIEDLMKEYDKGEAPWFSVNTSMKNDKGIDYCFSIRSLIGDAGLMKLNKLTGKDIAEQVAKIIDSLNDAGVGVDKSSEWGYVELYLKQTTVEERKTVLDQISSSIKNKSEDEKKALSAEIEKALEKTDLLDTPAEIEGVVNNAEKLLDTKTSAVKTADDTETPEEKSAAETPEEKSAAETPEEKGESEALKKIEDRIKENQATLLFNPLKDIIITIGTVEKDERGKLVYNRAIKAKKTETALKVPVDPEKQGIAPEYVETAKSYIEEVDPANILDSKIIEAEVNKAAQALVKDIKNIAALSDNSASEINKLSDEDFKFFILRLLNDKKLSPLPIDKEKLETVFGETIKHYGLSPSK